MPNRRRPGILTLASALALTACTLEPRPRAPLTGERGRRAELLLEGAGCLGCHAAPAGLAERIEPVPAPELGRIGARVTPQHLRRLLTDPQAARPGTRMPDLLAGLPADEATQAREDLLHFLVSRGGPLDQAAVEVDPGAIERGRLAYHELGCVACHPPLEEPWQLEYLHWALEGPDAPSGPDTGAAREAAPPQPWSVTPLGDLRRRTTAAALTEFLLDPRAARPHGRMPTLDLDPATAQDIARYLLRDAASDRAAPQPGLAVEVFEAQFDMPRPDFDALEVSARLSVASPSELVPPREDDFGFRLRGFLEIERAGTYVFGTTSDDGSTLTLDGELLVDNSGMHGMLRAEGSRWLESGAHALELTWFEHAGEEGFEVDWSGPGFERAPLPPERLTHRALRLAPRDVEQLTPDPERVARGAERFAGLGCGACHTLDGEVLAAPGAGALAELDPDARSGCLGTRPKGGVPRYRLQDDERELLADLVALAGGPWNALDEHERIARTLERSACLACHERDGRGGPAPERRPYYLTRGEADLGDEGRLPPTLDGIGAKLTPTALAAVLLEGERVRPYMATRMPRYAPERVADLAGLFEAVDARDLPPAREPSLAGSEHGPRLAGVRGLSCIQCHGFAGNKSLGIPAVDLADVTRRLRPGWFHQLLADPVSLGMNTRMPQFGTGPDNPVRDIFEGDLERQIDALWNYLSLGHAAPLPEGLVVPDEAYEIEVQGEPVSVGVFMQGVSPRTLCVGFPERIHYAYDVQDQRLARAWRGRFFNARGTWEGRAGAAERPPSDDVVDLTPGPVFARLADPDDPWPTDGAARHFTRTFDPERRQPVFGYDLAGVGVRETVLPDLRPGGAWLRRRFQFLADERPTNLWMRVGVGDSIQQAEDRTWVIDGRLRVELPEGARLRALDERVELLLPIELRMDIDTWSAAVEVAFTW